jgi:hypothetical protein
VDPQHITWRHAQPLALANSSSSRSSNTDGGGPGGSKRTSQLGATAAQEQEGGGRAWHPPTLQRPAFCNSLDARNAAFLDNDNHPCTFLSWPDVA